MKKIFHSISEHLDSSSGFVSLSIIVVMGVVTVVALITSLSVEKVQQEQQLVSEASPTSCSSYTNSTSCGAVPGCSWKPEAKNNCSNLGFDSCNKSGCSKQWDNCSLDNCESGCNYKEKVSTLKSCTLNDCSHDGCSYNPGGKVISPASCKNWEGTGCNGLGESACKDKEKHTLCYWQSAIYSQPSCSGSYRVVTREASCTGQVNKRCEGTYVTTPAQCTGTPMLRYTCSSNYQCTVAASGEFLDQGDCLSSCKPPPTKTPTPRPTSTPTPKPVNKCTQGNSYCANGMLHTCKADKSDQSRIY